MKLIKYALFALVVVSCNKKPAKNAAVVADPEKIKINLNDTSTLYAEDIMDSIRVLPLLNADSVSLSGLSKCFFTDNGIVISDSQASAAYFFNWDGVLVNTIKRNRVKTMIVDKDKVNFVNDVFYDSKEKLIEVLDLTSEKIFRFDTKGNLRDHLVLQRSRPFGQQYVAANNDYISLLANYNTDKRGLTIYKREGKLLEYNSQKLNAIPYLKHISVATHHQLEVYNNSAYCFPALEDKIYRISSSDTIPVYLLDYPHNKKLTEAVKQAHPTRDINTYFETMEKSNVVFDNNSLFINDNWVYFKFAYKYRNLQRNLLYSKKNKQIIQFSKLKSRTLKNLRYITIAGKDKDFFVAVNSIIKGPITKAKNSPRYVNYELIFFRPRDIAKEQQIAAR
jgi:hypothetical protein